MGRGSAGSAHRLRAWPEDVEAGLFVMWRVCVVLLAAGLIGLPLSACSRSKSKAPDVGFLPTRAVAQTSDPKAAFEDAKEACVKEARRKGISSVTRLLLLRGKTSKSDYIDCMEQKGYEVVDD